MPYKISRSCKGELKTAWKKLRSSSNLNNLRLSSKFHFFKKLLYNINIYNQADIKYVIHLKQNVCFNWSLHQFKHNAIVLSLAQLSPHLFSIINPPKSSKTNTPPGRECDVLTRNNNTFSNTFSSYNFLNIKIHYNSLVRFSANH